MREVLEETGVRAEFDSITLFRHTHTYAWGCSDLYFIAVLHPVSVEITRCEREIAECRWMKVCSWKAVTLLKKRGGGEGGRGRYAFVLRCT